MTRRELYRLKKRIKAHLKRAAVVLILLLAVVLMFCGCLYIGEHLFQSDKKTESEKTTGKETNEETVKDNDTEDVPSSQTLDTESQIAEKYNYQYTKPNAAGLHICLDAGHGGNDSGTLAGNVMEKDINFAITQKVAALLQEAGATISLVREADEYLDLAERTAIANQSGASYLVSLHCNYYEDDPTINGLEVYYHRNSETSKAYAETLTQLLRSSNAMEVRDASQQNMQVLRNSSIPAIMVEMGFLSNPEELANLSDQLYQEYFARVFVEALVQTLNPSAAGTQ